MMYAKRSMSSKKLSIRSNQRGIVSLMVTLIMIFVVSLLVIAFAQLTRRNQRAALDRQQSSQAYYAAETGINKAINYLNVPANRGSRFDTTGNCSGPSSFNNKLGYFGASVTIGANTSYNCLSVNSIPTVLVRSPLVQNDTLVWPVNAGSPISTISVSWAAPANTVTPSCPMSPSISTLPKYTSWTCSYGMMRLDIFDASTATNPAQMASATKTYYVFPSNGAGTSTISSTNRATLGITGCTLGKCTADFPVPGSAKYYVRLSMLYKDAGQVTVTAKNGLGTPLPVSGAQAVVDSTGKAQDQLRRVQVRVSLVGKSNDVSGFATQGAICKQITAFDGYYDKGICSE